jgi:hypothetical protein
LISSETGVRSKGREGHGPRQLDFGRRSKTLRTLSRIGTRGRNWGGMMTQEALYEGLGLPFDTFPDRAFPGTWDSSRERYAYVSTSEASRDRHTDRIVRLLPFRSTCVQGPGTEPDFLYWFDRTKDIVRNHQGRSSLR